MADLSPLWTFLLIATSLLFAELRLREMRSSTSLSMWVPGRYLADLVAGAVLLFTAGPLSGPLLSLASTSVASLAALGLLLGLAGLANTGFAAALAYSYYHPDAVLATWWAMLIVVGSAVRMMRAGPASLGGSATLRTQRPDASLLEFPGLSDVVWMLAARAVCLIPLAGVLLVPMPGASRLDVALRLGGAVLVDAQLLMYSWTRLPLTRFNRRSARISDVCLVFALTLITASPVGELATRWWAGIPALNGWETGRLMMYATAIEALYLTPRFTGKQTRGVFSRTLQFLFNTVRPVLLASLIPFFLAGVFHPMHGPLVTGTIGAAIGTVWLLITMDRIRISRQTVDAAGLLALDDKARRRLLGLWLTDAFIQRLTRPDYSLVRTLTTVAYLCSQAATVSTRVFFRLPSGQRVELGAAHVLPLISIAEDALDLVDEEVLPRCPPQRRQYLQFAQDVARADLTAQLAQISQNLDHVDDALAAGREAADRYQAVGAVSSEVVMRIHTAGYAHFLDRLDLAEEQLAQIRNHERIPPVMRRYLLVFQSHLKQENGDTETARALLLEARSITERSTASFRAALQADRIPHTAVPSELRKTMVSLEVDLERDLQDSVDPP